MSAAPLDSDNPSLPALLKAARRKRGWSQEYAATKFRKSKQRLSQFENGRARPQLDELVEFHTAMFVPAGGGDSRAASLARWIAAWVGEHKSARAATMSPADAKDYEEAMALLQRALPRPREGTAGSGRSLADFPDAFLPLQIIVGDRRETSTNRLSRGDLLALNIASSDLMFLGDLLLEYPAFLHDRPLMCSDKTMVLLDEATLRRRFGGSNLLIIGSPAVNWAARLTNPTALFRFDIERYWEGWDQRFRAHAKLGDKEIYRLFAQILKVAEKTGGKASLKAIRTDVEAMDIEAGVKTRSEYFDAALKIAQKVLGEPGNMTVPQRVTHEFQRSGFVDPADRIVHGTYTTQTSDFGVVALAPHPFAEPDSGYVAILAGGSHGPGTAHAVKFLTDPDNFAKRPFGGVIEVELFAGEEAAWPDRVRNATPMWQTGEYDAPQLLANLTAGAEPANPNAAAWRGRYKSSGELDQLREFVTRLSGGEVEP